MEARVRERVSVRALTAEVVVARNGRRLDAGLHERLHEQRLEARLARLEVVAGEEDALAALRELDEAAHEGVLRRGVDVRAALGDGRDGEDGRRRHLGLVARNGGQERLGRVIEPGALGAEALRVRGPEHDDSLERVLQLEGADLRADGLHVLGLRAAAVEEQVVRARALVLGDEVGVVDRLQRRGAAEGRAHVRRELALQVHVEHLRALDRLAQRQRRNVPAADDEVVRARERQQRGEGHEDVAALGADAEPYGARLREAAEPRGALRAGARAPLEAEAARDEARRKRGAVVAAEAHDHDARARGAAPRREGVLARGRLGLDAAAGQLAHERRGERAARRNVRGCVGDARRAHRDLAAERGEDGGRGRRRGGRGRAVNCCC